MRIRKVLCATLVVLGLGLCATPSVAQSSDKSRQFSTSPVSNDGKPWRIAYYEGGPHHNYFEYLRAVATGLMNLGWIRRQPLPGIDDADEHALWRWLVRYASNDNIQFLGDGFYSANWDIDIRAQKEREIKQRFKAKDDIDLVIAMGTWAGKDLASEDHNVPTVVMSTSDPIRTGIIKTVSDSGLDHVHARVDPSRYERQVRLFHDIIGFSKLGVAYEDTVEGRSYAAMDMVEKVASERGFEVVRCHTHSDIADQSLAAKSVLSCFDKLSKQADAIYVTLQGGVNKRTIPEMVNLANSRRVPTFSQSGSREVSYGFLLSISRPSFKPVGNFLARTVAQVLNGAKPRELTQLFEERPNIAINLKTAEVIGLYLYADVLAAADELYHKIQEPE